ncbi:MAG TPA: FoF1 ATP synthase subunit gamma [Polyangia bacterium]|nr:FoF1 ATP synthase subunit gamma [Polyangia bacterium]
MEVRARLGTMKELEEVLGAMRGMAAARIQQGERAQVAAREYAARIGAAFASLSTEGSPAAPPSSGRPARTLVVALCTERGFVGALNEHVLRAAREGPQPHDVLVVGARGLAFAREQGLTVTYVGNMATHLAGLGDVADQIGDLLLTRMDASEPLIADVIYPRRTPTGGAVIERQRLLPIDLPSRAYLGDFPPITMLPVPILAAQIAIEYVRARLFEFVAETFAAANAARLEVLQAAHAHLDEMLLGLRRTENVLRQEEITAEVLEVITGRMTGSA